MSRFLLSPGAVSDLEDIREYLLSLPRRPAVRIGHAVQETLRLVASRPDIGHVHEMYSTMAGQPIRTFYANQYVFLYAPDAHPLEFLGIIHGKRDIQSIMEHRLG